MNKKLIGIFVITLLIISLVFNMVYGVEVITDNKINSSEKHALSAVSWYIETVDSNGDVGRWNSIALDSNDNPHIAYTNDASHTNLQYATKSGLYSTWDHYIVDDEQPDYRGRYCEIALDSNDVPHIAYANGTSSSNCKNVDLMHAKRTSNTPVTWQVEFVDTENFAGLYPSIALDSNDNPHISYLHQCTFDDDIPPNCINPRSDLKYAYWDGVFWSIEWFLDDGTIHVSESSIALDSNDEPRISFQDSGANAGNLLYVESPTTLTYPDNIEYVDVDPQCRLGMHLCMELDSNDMPHIIYCDTTNHDLKYAYKTGSGWNIESLNTNTMPTPEDDWFLSLVLDSNDRPHISYYDNNSKCVKYARKIGVTWEFFLVDYVGTTSSVGGATSIDLDSCDYPHISYYDRTNGDLMYARMNGCECVIDMNIQTGLFYNLANPYIIINNIGERKCCGIVYNITTDCLGPFCDPGICCVNGWLDLSPADSIIVEGCRPLSNSNIMCHRFKIYAWVWIDGCSQFFYEDIADALAFGPFMFVW